MARFKAHPTVWQGIQFRSRLEAKYAAYFDGMGWAWTYEPFDLYGYTPDFIVHMRSTEYLVEVKPATKPAQLARAVTKLMRTNWTGPWIMFGVNPSVNLEGAGRTTHGTVDLGGESAWAEACNATQWKAPPPPKCAKCGGQEHLLHHLVCKG